MALRAPQQELAIRMLLDGDNIMTLAPVFVVVMRVVRDLYSVLDADFQSRIDDFLGRLFSQRSPLLSVEVNLAYYLQALARASCRQMMQLSDPTRFLKKRRPSYWVHPDSPRYSATSDSSSFDSTVNCR